MGSRIKTVSKVIISVLVMMMTISAAPSFVETVKIPGGTFTMGNTSGGPSSSDDSAYQVTVSPFLMGITEVTQKQFSAVMGFNPSITTGDNYPVENTTWFDAIVFCNELSLKEGLKPVYTIRPLKKEGVHLTDAEVSCDWSADGYRLPTEAEWEFAAKGGVSKQKLIYAGSSKIEEVAWFNDNSGQNIHPVAGKKANKIGLYDMSGNAWEWCWDWYGDYPTGAQTDPRGVEYDHMNPYKVQRGGSCCNGPDYAAVSYRFGTGTNYAVKTFGFRVVRSLARQ